MAEWVAAQGLADDRVRHAFMTRKGGVSTGLFASLNCALGSADERAAVLDNRARAAACVGAAPDELVSAYQVHSPDVAVVHGPWPLEKRPRADALVSAVPGLALAVSTADCAPVLLADARARVVGAAHAGWRGAIGGVLEATVEAMEALGARRADMRAAIGPTISLGAYEVGEEFRARFLEEDAANGRFFAPGPGGNAHFDLPAFVRARLEATGIGTAEGLDLCTYGDEERFFSYRRATHRGEPGHGGQLSIIRLVD